MSATRHAAFVIPHPYVDALACFREPIRLLAREGWAIDLYTSLSPQHPAPFFGLDNVRLIPIVVSPSGAVRLVTALMMHRPTYHAIVTVPQWGLHYAGIAARLAGIPMGCISDEIKTDAEAVSDRQRRWRDRERRAHRRCRWTIALSAERADFVRQENDLGEAHRIFVVPNAEAGESHRVPSRYFHEALALPPDARVLLHAGSLWWQGTADLIERARGWNDDWTVVFQIRLAGAGRPAAPPCIRFSEEVLPARLLNHAVSSATIGLALYDAQSTNNRLMGSASGKVSLYMRNTLPVIATRAGGFEWLEHEGCGVCIDDVSEIPAGADRIWREYGRYVANVKRCYDRSFEFTKHFRPVADFMRAA